METPDPPFRELTPEQKRAGITLVEGWKPKEPDPAGMYRCFASRAHIDGKDVMIGIGESLKLHRQAIWRGMTTETGELRPNLSWQEKLVMTLRQVTTPPDFRLQETLKREARTSIWNRPWIEAASKAVR